MEIYNFEQRTEDWYRVRLGVLSASDAATIAANGKGLETLCLHKAMEIITGKSQDSFVNDDIERGIELEDEARALYEITTGNVVHQVGFIKMDERIGCSPDGLVDSDGLVEYKCRNDLNHFKRLLGYKIDREHRLQMQMQLLVSERKWVDYVCYNRNFSLEDQLVIERVYPDEKDIKLLKDGLVSGLSLISKYLHQYKEKKLCLNH